MEEEGRLVVDEEISREHSGGGTEGCSGEEKSVMKEEVERAWDKDVTNDIKGMRRWNNVVRKHCRDCVVLAFVFL